MYCTICGKPSVLTIPGSTEPIYLCDSCTNITPLLNPQSIKNVNRQLSFETFTYFLTQIQENKRLVQKMVSMSQQMSRIQDNNRQSIFTSLQTQLEEQSLINKSLKTQLTEKSQLIQSLEIQIKDIQSQLDNSTSLSSLQQRIIDSMPSTETVENTTEEIVVSILTLQQSVNKVINMLEATSTSTKQLQVLPNKPYFPSKTPDIPKDDYEEGEYVEDAT